MLKPLSQSINTYSNSTRSTVSSLIREMKVDKTEFDSLIRKMSTFSAGADFAAQRIAPLSVLNREVLVELFRDSSLRIRNYFNGANAVGLALNSMIEIMSSEISKVEKDLDNLQIFIDNYEFISGKDDLFNSNYVEKFDSFSNNYTYDGFNFQIPDRDGQHFDSVGNGYIDPIKGTLSLGAGLIYKNIINNISSIDIKSNYLLNVTTETDFSNLFNDNGKDAWTLSLKTNSVITAGLSNFEKYIAYPIDDIPGAKNAVTVNLNSSIFIDSIRFNPNKSNGLQLLQIVLFNSSDQTSDLTQSAESYVTLLSEPKKIDKSIDVSFNKINVNKIIFIFNQSSYTRTRITPSTGELNSKLMSSFIENRMAEKRNKFSLFQDVVYHFFTRNNTVQGLLDNNRDSYYSYRFPLEIDRYKQKIFDEIFKVNNLNMSDRDIITSSPVFVDLFYGMLSYMDSNSFANFSNYYIESTEGKKGNKYSDYPGFIPLSNSNVRSNQKYQFFNEDTYRGNISDAIRKLLLNESTDSYEYNFSLKSIEFYETNTNDAIKACFVSRKIPAEGQINAVKAIVQASDNTIVSNTSALSTPTTSYELSVSNKEIPIREEDWIPLMYNSSRIIDSEVIFFDTTDYSYIPRFKASEGTVILYKNGIQCSASAYSYSPSTNTVTLINTSLISPGDIFSISYELNTLTLDPFKVSFSDKDIYEKIIKRYSTSKGTGQFFAKTDGNATVTLDYNPYIREDLIKSSTYSSYIGTIFSGQSGLIDYSPIKIRLSDGSYAVNITNYTSKPEKVSFYDTDLVLFMQSGKSIIFNQVINSSINVDYEYVPFNLRFRLIMRRNAKNITSAAQADSVILKMKANSFDDYYNRINKIYSY